MNFTGKNLELLYNAVSWAIDDVQGQIGSCPDVFEYEEDIEALEALKAQLEKLLARITASLERNSK